MTATEFPAPPPAAVPPASSDPARPGREGASRREALGYLAAGAVLPWLPRTARSGSDEVALWVADRGADRVHGLGADLVARRSLTVDAPVAVRARSGGGLWILSSLAGIPFGPHRLLAVEGDGSVAVSVDLGTCTGLAVDRHDRAWLLETGRGPGGGDRVWRVGPDGTGSVRFEGPDLTCLAIEGRRLLVGSRGGEVRAFPLEGPPGGPPLALGALLGEVGDLAAGPRPGTLWALDVTGPGRVSLLDAELAPLWSATTGLLALHLIPVPRQERIWLADTSEPWLRRLGPGGRLELEVRDLPLAGGDRGLAWPPRSPGRGVLVAAPGALLHVDAAGDLQPGQGGFRFLVDLCAAREGG